MRVVGTDGRTDGCTYVGVGVVGTERLSFLSGTGQSKVLFFIKKGYNTTLDTNVYILGSQSARPGP